MEETPLTRKRKSRLLSKFEKDYPFVKWKTRDLSIHFMIPYHELKPLMENKEETIKYIYKHKRQH